MRWELIPKIKSKRIIKVSHTDYYGLVWLRDIIIDKYSLPQKKSEFNFTSEDSLERCLERLKNWREYIKIQKIMGSKKLKKWKGEDYLRKLEEYRKDWSFVESIREVIIPS
jgi:hypothetical protein